MACSNYHLSAVIIGIFSVIILSFTTADTNAQGIKRVAKSTLTPNQLNKRTVTIEFKLTDRKKELTDSEKRAVRQAILNALNKVYSRTQSITESPDTTTSEQPATTVTTHCPGPCGCSPICRKRREVLVARQADPAAPLYDEDDLGIVETEKLDDTVYFMTYGVSDDDEITNEMLLEVINDIKDELAIASGGLEIQTSYPGLPQFVEAGAAARGKCGFLYLSVYCYYFYLYLFYCTAAVVGGSKEGD